MKDSKFARREFLQAMAAGSAMLPRLGVASSGGPRGVEASHAARSAAGLPDPTDLILESRILRVSFDRNSGALVGLENRLTGWKIQCRRGLARSFVLFAPMPERHFNPILGGKNALESFTKSPDGKSLTFVWQNLVSEHAGALDITLKGIVTLEENGLTFDSEIINRSSLPINSVSYPIVGDLSVPVGDTTLTRANLAYAGMQRVPLWPEFSNERGYFGVDNPIQMVFTPQRPFVLIEAEKQGLYAGAHDISSRELIEWTFELKPGYENSFARTAPSADSISGVPARLEFSVIHYPFAAPGETLSMMRVALQPYVGSWHNGVDLYKEWRSTWFKRPEAPAWAKDVHSWQQLNINSSEDDLRLRYEDLPNVGRECAKYGVKAIQLVGWNNGGQDRGNPSHDTDPRLGTKEELRDAIAEVQKTGVKIILFNKYTWADVSTEWFRKELNRYAALDPYGNYYQYQGYRYQTPTQLADINTRRFAVMCQNSAGWRSICVREFQKSIDLGAAGILYDEVQHHGDANYCFAPDHGHHVPANIYAGDALLGTELRKVAAEFGGDFLFAGEDPYDLELRHYFLSYFRINAGHVPLHRYIDPEAQMMVAASGFNDREMLNACLRYRYVISFEPYNFKGHLHDFPLTMEYGRKVDALRTRYKHYLWEAEFRDTLGAEVTVDGNDYSEYSVFGRPEARHRAVVITNQDQREDITALVRLAGGAGKLVVATPENPDLRTYSGKVEIPPRSAVVLLEGLG
jgi:hypothetical protein